MATVESLLGTCFSDATAALEKALAERDIKVTADKKDVTSAFVSVASAVVQHVDKFVCDIVHCM